MIEDEKLRLVHLTSRSTVLTTQEEEPFRLEIESKYFDSCFFISKPSSAPTENPFREADYADYSDKGLAH